MREPVSAYFSVYFSTLSFWSLMFACAFTFNFLLEWCLARLGSAACVPFSSSSLIFRNERSAPSIDKVLSEQLILSSISELPLSFSTWAKAKLLQRRPGKELAVRYGGLTPTSSSSTLSCFCGISRLSISHGVRSCKFMTSE